jgi:hypothetical protein
MFPRSVKSEAPPRCSAWAILATLTDPTAEPRRFSPTDPAFEMVDRLGDIGGVAVLTPRRC